MREQEPWVAKELLRAKLEQKANRKYLNKLGVGRGGKKLDDQFEAAHDEVFAKRDCMDCGNCCRTTSPIFRDVDIERLSKHLGMKAAAFEEEYLMRDTDEHLVLISAPCPFLEEDNSCGVYEHRPKACKEYPHTNRKRIQNILPLTFTNTLVCPAVNNIVRILRDADPYMLKNKERRGK